MWQIPASMDEIQILFNFSLKIFFSFLNYYYICHVIITTSHYDNTLFAQDGQGL